MLKDVKPRMTRWNTLASLLLVSLIPVSSAIAGGSGSFVYSIPDNSEQILPLSPGATTEFAIAAENQGTAQGSGHIALVVLGDDGVRADYLIIANDPVHCQISTGVTNSSFGELGFLIGPVQAGERQLCSFRLSRTVGSQNDFSLAFCGPSNDLFNLVICAYNARKLGATWVAGTLPDLTLRASPTTDLRAGALEATLRISVSNPGNQDAVAKGVETQCVEFGGGFFGPSPFDIDNDFPGACPSAPTQAGCGNFTGMHFSSKAYSIGPIPAHDEASCLLHVRFLHPLTAPVSLGFGFQAVVVPYVNGGIGVDPDRSNEITALAVGPQAIEVPATRWNSLVVLILLLGATAISRHRHARCGQGSQV